MFQSRLFTTTLREAPKDEEALNAKLLIRAGFIHKTMAGVYSLLPLGLRVINNIENIIRGEMNAIGGLEMRTSVLQNKEIWERSGRWSDKVVDSWFKVNLKSGGQAGLSFTNEEAYSSILKQYVSSYRDLPLYPYDFKSIFRNETRSKSGIIRGREFYWKALYSFSKNNEEHQEFYEKAKQAYRNVFDRAGIGKLTYLTFASGGTFSRFSHEFQTLAPVGEDTIYLDENSGIAVNKEVYGEDILSELNLRKENLVEKRAVEVGNIFSLGTKFSEPFDLKYRNESGEENLVVMGSYGIGLGRLMGTVAEVLSDEKGLIWPESISPFQVHLLQIGGASAREAYEDLQAEGIDVLYDERDVSAGEKFADADLLGIPWRLLVSEKTGGKVEIKRRNESEVKVVKIKEAIKMIKP